MASRGSECLEVAELGRIRPSVSLLEERPKPAQVEPFDQLVRPPWPLGSNNAIDTRTRSGRGPRLEHRL
jgi:hypothetical protein